MEPFAKLGIVSVFGKSKGEELEDLGVPLDGAIGEGEEPVSHVAYSEYLKCVAKNGRASARVKGGDQVDRVVGVTDEALARLSQRRAAAQKKNLGTKLWRALIQRDSCWVGEPNGPCDVQLCDLSSIHDSSLTIMTGIVF
jgi:hypothetical protein